LIRCIIFIFIRNLFLYIIFCFNKNLIILLKIYLEI
jgi:hypothetical protein